MAEAIPPWLDFSPATFVGAAEAGQRLEQGREQIGLERARLAQSASQAAAELGLRSQQLNDAQKDAAMRHQLETEQLQNQFLRQQGNAAVTKAYHDAQIGLAQNRLDLEGQKISAVAHDKALELADRQNYAMAISGGMTPAEALAKYPRALASASALNRGATDTQTVTEHFKEQPATAEIAGTSPTPGYDRSWFDPRSWMGYHHVDSEPGTPAIPGTPERPAYTVSRKIPGGTPAQYALNPSGTNAAPALATAPTNSPPEVGRPPGPKLKFIRDENGNLILADAQTDAQ